MPSASAKIEKVASVEAADPMKQVTLMMEKKVRNLEKRKLKLDNYKNDVANGKELNEDQKMAVSKYDQVLDLLEFAKEVNKSCNIIVAENTKVQKKLAKREQIERQQHEIHRLQEALLLKHILSKLEEKEVQDDFANGHNGAIQLSEQHISCLNQLFKLVEPALPNEQGDVESYFHSLAEHTVFLLDGKNREVAGTTYKHLKELLCNIKECGYFTRTSGIPEEAVVSGDEATDTENGINGNDIAVPNCEENPQTVSDSDAVDKPKETYDVGDNKDKTDTLEKDTSCNPITTEPEMPQNASVSVKKGSLHEVLSSQGSFNFLQESQIDLESPHMDPAVVAVHQMAPPPAINFSSYAASQTQQSPEDIHNQLNNAEVEHCEIPIPQIQQQMPVLAAARTMAPVLASVQHSSPHDFDPSHPIPTQTFTNQSFAVMQNMMMPSAYVPVTMHHGPIPPHMTPLAVVPGISPNGATTTSGTVSMHVAVTPVSVSSAGAVSFPDEKVEGTMGTGENQHVPVTNGNGSCCDTDTPQNEAPVEKTISDTEGFTTQNNYRGGYRGRGRGRGPMNGYYRGGRNNYNNGRGAHQGQNTYYPQGSNYNGGSFRRGNSRGPRGTGNQRGGRGGNYRSQGSGQQQQQKETQQ